MPKMLINAQKEQICRSQGLPGIGRLRLWLEFLQNVTKLITTLALMRKGETELEVSNVTFAKGGRR